MPFVSELRAGDLVRPVKNPTWKLGVVEAVDAEGRHRVRSYVAPPRSYEGSIGHYRRDELVLVPVQRVTARLATVRAEIANRQELAQQIENALAATRAS